VKRGHVPSRRDKRVAAHQGRRLTDEELIQRMWDNDPD
jgi:hypothetical protein